MPHQLKMNGWTKQIKGGRIIGMTFKPEKPEPVWAFTLTLTRGQIEMLRSAISDLGYEDPDGTVVQLRVANALLDAGYKKNG